MASTQSEADSQPTTHADEQDPEQHPEPDATDRGDPECPTPECTWPYHHESVTDDTVTVAHGGEYALPEDYAAVCIEQITAAGEPGLRLVYHTWEDVDGDVDDPDDPDDTDDQADADEPDEPDDPDDTDDADTGISEPSDMSTDHQAVYDLVRAGTIRDHAITLGDLRKEASGAGIDADWLDKVLVSLVAFGFVESPEDGVYLAPDAPGRETDDAEADADADADATVEAGE